MNPMARSIDELRASLSAAGARPRHETLALRAWTRGLPLGVFGEREDSPFPRALRTALPALEARFAAHDGFGGTGAFDDDALQAITRFLREDGSGPDDTESKKDRSHVCSGGEGGAGEGVRIFSDLR